MILYDTPGVIEKKMHKLDSMMMNNVRSAAVNADCALVVVDACKAPQQVFLFIRKYQENLCFFSDFSFPGLQIDEVLEEGIGGLKDKLPILLVLNKKDLIKPGEIAKKLEVNIFCNLHNLVSKVGFMVKLQKPLLQKLNKYYRTCLLLMQKT